MSASLSRGTVSEPTAAGGFTLVEVMVALTILSLVMLATVTGLRTLARTQTTIERQTARVDEVRTVSSFLRDTMESALVGQASGGLNFGGKSRGSGYFALSDQTLAWKATVQFGESYGGSYLVRVANEDGALVLRWQDEPLNSNRIEWGMAPQRTLVKDLEEFQLSWRENFQDDWQREWNKGDEAGWVRMQVKASGRYWPELIIQVPR